MPLFYYETSFIENFTLELFRLKNYYYRYSILQGINHYWEALLKNRFSIAEGMCIYNVSRKKKKKKMFNLDRRKKRKWSFIDKNNTEEEDRKIASETTIGVVWQPRNRRNDASSVSRGRPIIIEKTRNAHTMINWILTTTVARLVIRFREQLACMTRTLRNDF